MPASLAAFVRRQQCHCGVTTTKAANDASNISSQPHSSSEHKNPSAFVRRQQGHCGVTTASRLTKAANDAGNVLSRRHPSSDHKEPFICDIAATLTIQSPDIADNRREKYRWTQFQSNAVCFPLSTQLPPVTHPKKIIVGDF